MAITKPDDIINETINEIDSVKETILSLDEDAIIYKENYEKYAESALYDATLLKNKMKKAVIKAGRNEI